MHASVGPTRRLNVVLVQVVAGLALSGCGGQNLVSQQDGDGDPDAPSADDAGANDGGRDDALADLEETTSADDAAPPTDGSPPVDGTFPPYTEIPMCGNGVLDEGEECDDRNRLDGDGCDWNCRLGDGDPPPAPDPATPDYVPASDEPTPVMIGSTNMLGVTNLPLVWTGTNFATAWYQHLDSGGRITFRSFDAETRHLGIDWTYEAPNLWFGLDLVWTGSGFGLFYSDADTGIYYLPLEANGKPIGVPRLVEPDPQARGPSADVDGDGFVLAWVHETEIGPGWSLCGSWEDTTDSVRVRHVGVDGSTSGDPVIVETRAGGAVDIATGDGSYGLVVWMNGSLDYPSCAARFVWVRDDFSEAVLSGVLGYGDNGDVKWTGDRYVTAWKNCDTLEGGTTRICVGRFSAAGVLEGPPVCTIIPDVDSGGPSPVRIAAGDAGLFLLSTFDMYRFAWLRTDAVGAAVGPVGDVVPRCTDGRCEDDWAVDNYNTVWADTGFGVLFSVGYGFVHSAGLYLSMFVAE